jgi:hypothetical protein
VGFAGRILAITPIANADSAVPSGPLPHRHFKYGYTFGTAQRDSDELAPIGTLNFRHSFNTNGLHA